MEKNKKIIIGVIAVVILLIVIALIFFFVNKANKTYTVTFDSKGGTEVASQTIKENEAVTKPVDPTKEGYTFLGWYVSESSVTPYNFETKVNKDFTLIAKWEEAKKTITNVSIVTDKKEITVNEELSLTAKVMAGNEEVKDGELVWTSSDETIATVDKTGKVKALKAGTVTITVTANGVKSEIKLTIKAEETVQTNTKPVSNNTKPSTTKPTTGGNTTKPQTKVTYSYQWEKIDSSVAGQYMLYIVSSEGKRVAGTVTLTTISGTSSTVSVPATGAMYVKDAIASVLNVKAAQ